MKTKIILIAAIFLALLWGGSGWGQNIGINVNGTPANSSSLLDIDATGMSPKAGFLIPRMTTADRNAITTPAQSLFIFNTTTNCFEIYNTATSSWQSIYCFCANPAAPVATVASGVSQTSFFANWNSVPGATGYYLDVSTVNTFASFVTGYNNLNVGNITVYNVNTNLTCATTYYYRVRAYNSCGTSASSNTITQATTACCALTVSAGSNQNTNCGGASFVIGGAPTASGGTGPYTYAWTPTTALSNPAIANPTATPNSTTIYTVFVTDATGCIMTSNITITVNTPCVSDTWCQKANFGGTARYVAVGFSIGTKGYIGTGYNGAAQQDFWEWDQASNVWTQKANFGGTARRDAVGFSIGTKGYIGLGSDGAAKQDFWEWDQAINTWTQKANFGGTARYSCVGFSIGAKGYIGTGWDGAYKQDFWEWDQATNVWTQKANFPGPARTRSLGFSIGTRGYMGTGADAANYQDFWEWDQATNVWTQKANFGGGVRRVAVGFSIGSKGYIGTGKNPTLYLDFWEYTWGPGVMGGSWAAKANFGGTAREAAVGFSIGTKGYIGTGFDGAYKQDFWEYCQ